MVNKRGQAAMEFLMTYGWALLVVLVAIGALAFFGVLDPGKFLPSTCTITPGIACNDFKATTSTIDVVLSNGMGESLTGVTVSYTGCTTASTAADLADGATATHSLSGCTNGASGDKLKADLIVSYTSESGLAHSKTGQLVTQVE